MKNKIFFLLSLFWLVCYSNVFAVRSFIVDTDVGIDDAIALLYLLQRLDVDVKAITIEGNGNAHCKPAIANTYGLLHLVHRTEIPVACGRSTPLKGHHVFPKKILQMCDTLAGVSFVKPIIPPIKKTAKNVLVTTLRASSFPVDILALGPLTTIAEVLTQHPDLKNKIRMIYIMGGAVRVPGNIHEVDPRSDNQVAEWNMYIDPYAAEKVFASGVPITLVPLDVTNQVVMDMDFYERVKAHHATPAAGFVYALLNANKQMLLDKEWYFWDPLAAVIATDESVVTMQQRKIRVILQPENVSGQTIIDPQGHIVRLCTAVDQEKFKHVLLDALL